MKARRKRLPDRLAPWLLMLPMALTQAATVRDLSGREIGEAVRAPGIVVAQFTSSDPGCGFCRGQANAFDQMAASYAGPATFARVQWTPWRDTPAMDLPKPVYGIPTIYVYRNGRAVAALEGSVTRAEALHALIDAAAQGHIQPRFVPEVQAESPAQTTPKALRAAPAVALTDADRGALYALARRDLASAVIKRCSEASPADAPSFQAGLDAFERRERARLEQASKLLLMGSAGRTEMAMITDEAVARLRNESAMDSLSVEGCRRLASALLAR